MATHSHQCGTLGYILGFMGGTCHLGVGPRSWRMNGMGWEEVLLSEREVMAQGQSQ